MRLPALEVSYTDDVEWYAVPEHEAIGWSQNRPQEFIEFMMRGTFTGSCSCCGNDIYIRLREN